MGPRSFARGVVEVPCHVVSRRFRDPAEVVADRGLHRDGEGLSPIIDDWVSRSVCIESWWSWVRRPSSSSRAFMSARGF